MSVEIDVTASASTAMTSDALPARTFDPVVVQDARRLYSLAFLILRDAGEAEDAVQETQLKAWRSWEALSHTDRPAAWLTRVCVEPLHQQAPSSALTRVAADRTDRGIRLVPRPRCKRGHCRRRPRIQAPLPAGTVGVAVIAAAAAAFAIELSNHNHSGGSPAGQSSVTLAGLPKLGPSPPLPADYQILVPVTVEKGSATLPSFTPLEHYSVDSACIGPGTIELVGSDGTVMYDWDCSSRNGPVSSIVWAYSRDQVLGKPVTFRVRVDPSTIWEILIYESASAPPPSLPAAFDTFTAPPGSKTLVAATKGTGTVTLPTFNPTERYYIVSTCTGGGSMVIASQPAEGGPGSSSCLSAGADDFLAPADVVMGEPVTLTVIAPASSSWEILVYETDQPDGA